MKNPRARSRVLLALALALTAASCAAGRRGGSPDAEWSGLGQQGGFARYGDARARREPAAQPRRPRELVIGDAPWGPSGGEDEGDGDDVALEEGESAAPEEADVSGETEAFEPDEEEDDDDDGGAGETDAPAGETDAADESPG